MNTLALKTELAHLTLSRRAFGCTPEEVIQSLRQAIKGSRMPLGSFRGMRCTSRRNIGKDLNTAQYVLLYEGHALLIKLTNFLPRNRWEISACTFM